MQTARDILAGDITVRWVAITLLGGGLNKTIIPVLFEAYLRSYGPQLGPVISVYARLALVAIIVVLIFLFPILYSIMASLYLYNRGEKRIVSPLMIQLITITVILATVRSTSINDLYETFFGTTALLIAGLFQDAIVLRSIGIAGGMLDCLMLRREANSSLDSIQRVLDKPTRIALGIPAKRRSRKDSTIRYSSPPYERVSQMLFMRSSPSDPGKTFLHFVAYLKERYRITRNELVQRTADLTMTGLEKLLGDEGISLAPYYGPVGEDWFRSTREKALSLTRMRLGFLTRIPRQTWAILLVIVVATIGAAFAYTFGVMSAETLVNVTLTILLTIAVLIPHLKVLRRR